MVEQLSHPAKFLLKKTLMYILAILNVCYNLKILKKLRIDKSNLVYNKRARKVVGCL